MCIPPEVGSLCKDNTEKKYYYKALKAEKKTAKFQNLIYQFFTDSLKCPPAKPPTPEHPKDTLHKKINL